MDEKWALRFEADPGLYSDFEDINGDDFNAPLALRLTWSQSSNLTWVVGIGADWRSGTPVIGGPEVRWKFARDLDLMLGHEVTSAQIRCMFGPAKRSSAAR